MGEDNQRYLDSIWKSIESISQMVLLFRIEKKEGLKILENAIKILEDSIRLNKNKSTKKALILQLLILNHELEKNMNDRNSKSINEIRDEILFGLIKSIEDYY